MFRFPFGTVQELNLDWFLEQWEIFKVQAREAFEGIDHALDDEIDRVEDAMTDLYAARDAAIAAKNAAETAESSTLGYAQSAANSATSAAGSAAGSAASASNSAGSAQSAAQSAQTSAQQASSAATSAGNAATSATNASTSAATAANNATIATNYSQESAAWATGSYTGDPLLYPVPSTAPQHENNAKYYAESISGDAASAAASASDAADSATAAAASAASVSASAAQIAQNASDISDLQTAMTAAQGDISTLQTDLDAAESDIAGLQTDLDAAESDISELQTDLDAAESDISELQTDLDAAESDIANLENIVDTVDEHAIATFPLETLENVPIASFPDGSDNIPVKELTVYIKPKQAGTGTPSPANPRAISGYTECEVVRTGKNLIDTKTLSKFELLSGTTKYGVKVQLNPGTYYLSATKSSEFVGERYIYARLFTLDGIGITSSYYFIANNTITNILLNIEAPCMLYVFSQLSTSAASSYDTMLPFNIQLEYSSSASAYDAFLGNQFLVSWNSEAGTVYGATLKINDNGHVSLSADRDVLTINGSTTPTSQEAVGDNWQRIYTISGGLATAEQTDVIANIAKTDVDATTAEQAAEITTLSLAKGNQTNAYILYVVIPNCASAENATAFLNTNPITICYPTATPLVCNFTVEETEIVKTLYGYNNIWTVCGNLDITYRAWNNPDPKIKLVKAIIAPVLDEMKADTALNENDFRIVGNTLYRITASVASGGTLTPNTNCIATTVCAEITSILNS